MFLSIFFWAPHNDECSGLPNNSGFGGILNIRDSGDVHLQDNFVMAIYPNTPYNLTQKHVEYVKQKEWLDAMAPVR